VWQTGAGYSLVREVGVAGVARPGAGQTARQGGSNSRTAMENAPRATDALLARQYKQCCTMESGMAVSNRLFCLLIV
jgi:hypothetical protein